MHALFDSVELHKYHYRPYCKWMRLVDGIVRVSKTSEEVVNRSDLDSIDQQRGVNLGKDTYVVLEFFSISIST